MMDATKLGDDEARKGIRPWDMGKDHVSASRQPLFRCIRGKSLLFDMTCILGRCRSDAKGRQKARQREREPQGQNKKELVYLPTLGTRCQVELK
jgi:hypothetical protein